MTTRRQFRSTRRRLLGAAAAAGATAVAGCSSSTSEDDECTEGDRSSVAAERAIPSADVREVAAPIRFEELSDAEKDVAAQAIRGDSYGECPPLSEEFASVLELIRERRDRQQERSEENLTTVYLIRARTYYALSAEHGDVAISY